MRTFGLIGETLSHSFSEGYFNKKFHKEDINDAEYQNFELNNISEFTDLVSKMKLSGLNVTIPYKESVIPFLDELTPQAKAIQHGLKKMKIEYKIISRNSSFDYLDISIKSIGYYNIIINTTPLGAYPKIADSPQIPYKELNENHLLYDLIYNPQESAFLHFGKTKNCSIKNGLEMLEIQAESSWNIWNS